MRKHRMQYHFWRSVQRYPEVREQTEQLLEQVRLQDKQTVCAAELSYSEQRALEIGMTLACDPRVILLDEPMAGMSHEETDYALNLIREVTQGRSLLIVEHDMDVVFEHVGADTWQGSLLSMKPGARLVTCGSTSGVSTTMNLMQLFQRQYKISARSAPPFAMLPMA